MNKIFYIVTLILVIFNGYSHEMPPEVKKNKIAKLLVKSDDFDLKVSEKELKDGDFVFRFDLTAPFEAIGPLFHPLAESSYMVDGDQDLEVFYLSFSSNNMDYELKCDLYTSEQDNAVKNIVKYHLILENCKIHNLTNRYRNKLHGLQEGTIWTISEKY